MTLICSRASKGSQNEDTSAEPSAGAGLLRAAHDGPPSLGSDVVRAPVTINVKESSTLLSPREPSVA